MKTRRGKRSEAFWPSIVMKKWLNIKPEVYDFSEDEVETETESEDDAYSLKDARLHDGVGEDEMRRSLGNQPTGRSQISGIKSILFSFPVHCTLSINTKSRSASFGLNRTGVHHSVSPGPDF